MKKSLSLLIVLTMLICFSACNDDKEHILKDDTQGYLFDTTSTAIKENNFFTETTAPSINNVQATDSTHAHKYVTTENLATCTKDGYTLHTCSCGDSYFDNRTVANGHNYGEWEITIEPTTTTTGVAERKCLKCGEKETKVLGKQIDNHKHSYSTKITSFPTCITEGIKTYSCSCGDCYNESIPSVEHQYNHQVTNPTCTNEGYTTYTCSVCQNSYRDNFTHPTEHNWQAATCTVKKTCVTCGKTEGEVCGHNWLAATCTQPSICKNCGETTGSALGHNWVDATCTDAKKCIMCKVTEGSAKGHDWIDGNCTTPKTCNNCNKIEGEAVHKYEGDICILCECKKPSEGLSFYEYKGGYYLLTVGSCSDTDIVIPTTYRGVPVIGIYTSFAERSTNDDRATINIDDITSVYIPNCVTDIRPYAFSGCSNLTSIIYGGTMQEWNAVSKGKNWYSEWQPLVVVCTDGSVSYPN